MRVLHLYAENVLNLRAVAITPNGRVTRITGKNGAGKSNVLNAMFYALAGKKGHATQPIRVGQQKATVRLDLGEDDKVEVTVKLRITEANAYLDVESPEGAVFRSPQAMLDALIGNLMFDPQAFSRMAPAARLETLRGLVKLDVDLDRLDELNVRDHTLRADWNRRVKSLSERVTTLGAGIDSSIDVAPIDIAALTEQMAQASRHNQAIDTVRATYERTRLSIADKRFTVSDKREAAAQLLREAAVIEDEANALQAVLDGRAPLPDPIDVADLRDEINAATKTNAQRGAQQRQREALRVAEEELAAARAASKKLTEAMDARDQQKADAIGAAKMPIKGLGFGNGDVTFKGLPFAQASTGQQLRIATAIGMALNPKLRVLFVRDGSLLDSDSLAILEQMAEEHDFQVWLEATQDAATTGIHIVDGSVAAVDGVAVGEETLAEVGD